MKLTERTIPQAKNYQCNKCKAIKCSTEMFDKDLCYACYDKGIQFKPINQKQGEEDKEER